MLHYFSVLSHVFYYHNCSVVFNYYSYSVSILKAGTATTIATGLTLGKDLIWVLMLYRQTKMQIDLSCNGES